MKIYYLQWQLRLLWETATIFPSGILHGFRVFVLVTSHPASISYLEKKNRSLKGAIESKMHHGSSNFWRLPIYVLKLWKNLSRSLIFYRGAWMVQRQPHQPHNPTWPCHNGVWKLRLCQFSKNPLARFLPHSQLQPFSSPSFFNVLGSLLAARRPPPIGWRYNAL